MHLSSVTASQILAVLALAAIPATNAAPSKELTRAQARAINDAVLAAHRSGKSVRGLLDNIFGGDSNDSDGYAPYNVTCPSDITWVRNATSIGTVEQNYINQRASQLSSAWSTQISNVGLQAPPRTPVVSMALSGGGYRAMISGSGMAFQPNSTSGSVGDILGLSTYVSGLSGGSWAVATFFANNGENPDQLAQNVWNIDSNLVVPSDDKLTFYYDLISEVGDKADKGFSTQITDYWSLALTDHLFPEQYHTNNHPNLTWNDIANVSRIQDASLPWPIVIAVEREPGELVIPLNSTVYEFTLAEFGSWVWGSERKDQGGFTSLEYLGTSLNNGQPTSDTACVKGFDNAGFVAGTSSTLFNQAFLQLSDSNSSSIITDAIQNVLGAIGSAENDVAVYPNPFYQWHAETSPIAGFRNLTLVDGGEANENVPFEPFLFSYRNVDAILAFDNSADTTYFWPNGSSLHTTYQKAIDQAQAYNISLRMPPVPSTQGFVNGGLNTRPTFFGCNDSSLPTVIYVPNYPWSAWSNTSTYMLEYSTDQAVAIIDNGRRTLDLNGTISNWPQCLTCAFMDNAVMENGGTRSAECEACFSRFCWDGTDNTTVSHDYAPVIGTLPAFFTNGTTAPSAPVSAAPSASSGNTAAATTSSTSGAELMARASVISVAAAAMVPMLAVLMS
ncbi:hypothetical protein QFC24_000901 [Naganishia onofrii]|uniref:Uncharacterized protein n=1 Tax=Naganishia onofrii TaxID=1851511 RepID=A0ACC2XU30_9TREE|nr:hypothetical protein QFC24_000901 [Naganishia onofrii]